MEPLITGDPLGLMNGGGDLISILEQWAPLMRVDLRLWAPAAIPGNQFRFRFEGLLKNRELFKCVSLPCDDFEGYSAPNRFQLAFCLEIWRICF